jgi:hypothetical protein
LHWCDQQFALLTTRTDFFATSPTHIYHTYMPLLFILAIWGVYKVIHTYIRFCLGAILRLPEICEFYFLLWLMEGPALCSNCSCALLFDWNTTTSTVTVVPPPVTLLHRKIVS